VTVFQGAASAYPAYRPGLPDDVSALLASTVRDVPWPALLDLGSGTGQVRLALHSRVSRIDIVDVDAGMLAEAQRQLTPLIGDIPLSAYLGPAEDFTPVHPDYRAHLVAACRSFHWMNASAVLRRLEAVTAPDAHVAIMGDGSLWTARSAWTDELRALIQSHLGTERRAGSQGTYQGERRPYRDVLVASAFSEITAHTVPVHRPWTVDGVLGYLDSTSYAAPGLFGDRHTDFRQEARDLLTVHEVDGVLAEDAVFTVLFARRPKGAGR